MRWSVELENEAGERVTVEVEAPDPDDACCGDWVDQLPPEWGENPDVEVVGVH